MAAIEANAPQNADADSAVAAKAAESEVKLDWKAQKEEQAKKRKRQNELKRIEDRISELELRSQEIDELLTQENVYTNMSECLKLNKEQEAIKAEMDQLFEDWEELDSAESQ